MDNSYQILSLLHTLSVVAMLVLVVCSISWLNVKRCSRANLRELENSIEHLVSQGKQLASALAHLHADVSVLASQIKELSVENMVLQHEVVQLAQQLDVQPVE